MTAPFHPHHEAKLLVLEILTRQHPNGPYGLGVFTADEWAAAARFAADMGDYAEITDMMADEAAHERNPGVWRAA